MTSSAGPEDEPALEELLSRPPGQLVEAFAATSGDIMVLGAGGKMGPSIARMARRTAPDRRITAVSRWSDPVARDFLSQHGVETIAADLLSVHALAALPDAPNVIFMAGQKFGTTGNPANTWAMNAAVPAFVADRFSASRIVVFSTGNVYALTSVTSRGARETDVLAPIGEYAWSCMARERIFAAAAERANTPVGIVRLNYAHDLRYGVLTDIAARLYRRQPIDLRMSCVNVIWQGDANAIALATLAKAASPEPYIVNVAGGETLRVRDLAAELANRLRVEPVFAGEEKADALLSDSTRMKDVLEFDLLPLPTLLDWVADWILANNRLLGKPTGFEKRDGAF